MTEKPTNELLNILKNTSSKKELNRILLEEDFPYSDISFSNYFNQLINTEPYIIDKSELVKLSKIERTYCYQILNGTRTPGRDKIIALCLAAKFDETLTNRCLNIAKCSMLYAKNRRDAVVIYALQNKLTIIQLNSLLMELNEPLLD